MKKLRLEKQRINKGSTSNNCRRSPGDYDLTLRRAARARGGRRGGKRQLAAEFLSRRPPALPGRYYAGAPGAQCTCRELAARASRHRGSQPVARAP